ncbi:MAG: hypothetical protein K6A92_03130 [Lachnospiraceae bacterium]|nr:hypothetical protein [Lachnospiraceae bacterium]
MEEEGDYPVIYGDEAIRIDNFTDKIIVSNTLINSEQPFISAIYMGGYFRYWHGYVMFLKPLLSLLGLNQIRKILMVLSFSMMVACLLLLHNKLKIPGAMAFAMMWMDYYSSKVSGTMQFFWPYFIMCSAIIILCLISDKGEKEKDLIIPMLFFGAGSFVNFVDLLTFPLVTLTVPLLVYLLIERDTIRKNLIRTGFLSVMWGAGYALTWVVKWVISALFIPGEVLANIKETISFRMQGDEAHQIDRLFVLQGNLQMPYFLHHMKILLPILAVLVIAYLIVVREKETILFLCTLIPVILYPYIWYEFFCSHSIIHAFFTYRAQMGTSFGLYYIMVFLICKLVKRSE